MRYWVAALLLVAAIGLSGRCQAAVFVTSYEGSIVMMGRIEEGDHDKFLKGIALNGKPHIVVVNGPGGVMVDALSIGEYIHENKIKTIAFGGCYSGCAYIWMGGTRRGLMGNAVIGFHAASDMDTGKAQPLPNAILGKYLSDCGADYRFIMAALAGGQEFRVFGFNDIERMEKEFNFYIFPVVTKQQVEFFVEMTP